jgi:hypothetical protein
VRVLALVFVSVMPYATWAPEPANVAVVGLAVRTLLLPPPPPLLEPLNVTVIITSVPVGEVGCRVTVAAAPEAIPAVVLFLRPKVRDAGVTVGPVTTSQLPEPVESLE